MKSTRQHPKNGILWPLLTVSVALNLAGVAWGLHRHFGTSRENSVQRATASREVSPLVAAAPHAVSSSSGNKSSAPAPARKFHWRELEAQDFDTYISRLREVGCPEATIRNIVVGELKAESMNKRAELERKILRSTDWSPPRGVSRQEYLAAQLRKLDRELEVTTGDLMQSSPGLDGQSAIAGTGVQGKPPVQYPAVMEDVTFQPAMTDAQGQSPATSKPLNYVAPGMVEAPPEVLASIQEIQQNFVQDIGGPNQDVEDPQYESAWRTAQWKADQIFRARHGWAAHNDLVRAAALKAYEEQRASNP